MRDESVETARSDGTKKTFVEYGYADQVSSGSEELRISPVTEA